MEGEPGRPAVIPAPPFRSVCLALALTLAASYARAQDGAVDLRFDAGRTGASDDVYAAACLPGGGVILGGYFTAYDGQPRWRLVRLRPDGALDPGFDPGAGSGSAPVARVAALPDGRLLVAGPFSRFGGQRRALVARLNADGSLDPSFDAGQALASDGAVNVLAALPGGTILIGGRLRTPTDPRSAPGSLLVRLRPDASRDSRFACALPPQGDGDQAEALAMQPDGKVLLGTRHRIIRLQADGALDSTFHPPPELAGAVQAVAAQPDGKILLVATRPSGGWRLWRLDEHGEPDPAFHPPDAAAEVPGGVNAILALPGGRILLGGSFQAIGGARRHGLARLNADGTLDPTFNPGTGVEVLPLDEADETPEATVRVLLPLPDGMLLVAGRFDLFNGAPCRNVARVYLSAPPSSLLPHSLALPSTASPDHPTPSAPP